MSKAVRLYEFCAACIIVAADALEDFMTQDKPFYFMVGVDVGLVLMALFCWVVLL